MDKLRNFALIPNFFASIEPENEVKKFRYRVLNGSRINLYSSSKLVFALGFPYEHPVTLG